MTDSSAIAAPTSRVGRNTVALAERYNEGRIAGNFFPDTDPRHRGMNWKALREGVPTDREVMDPRGIFVGLLLALPLWLGAIALLRAAS